jgi:hypothetical protein
MRKLIAVEESQGVEGRKQHFPKFIGGKGPVGKDLSQSLLCILHNDEEKRVSPELALTRVEQANEVRVGEGGSRSPFRELRLRMQRISWDQLDRRIRSALYLGKECYAVV